MIERKLIVITNDLPWPPRYGHKVDQFHRWKGFAERGWRLRLICWRSPLDPPSSHEDVDALSGVFETIDVLPIGHGVLPFARRLALLPRWPSHVAARIPSRRTLARLIAEAWAFAPDAVVQENIYGAELGNRLAKACRVPTILRGQNVEHVYFAQQARAARDLRSRLAWTIARAGLARWEEKVTRDAALSLQISARDEAFWRARGIDRIAWAPTIYPGPEHGTLVPAAGKAFDVAYIGNMRLPNNLQGLGWFVHDVLPALRALRPGVQLCFAGADPSPQARALFAAAPEITLVPDARSADAILAQGRVLVNPILSGSGVNVKSIDMLRYDAPIVTTSIGAQGFGSQIDGQFIVRDDAQGFAEAIVTALADPQAPPGRAQARALFGEAGLDAQIAMVERAITAWPSRAAI